MLSSVYTCCIVDYLFGVLHFANYAPECGIGIYIVIHQMTQLPTV